MGILQNIVKLIGWLSGSLAGITAILYACGYLIGQSYLHLLGINGIVQYSNQDYLQRGASFWFDLLGVFGNLLLPIVATAVILAVISTIVFKLCMVFGKTQFGIRKIANWITEFCNRLPWFGRAISYGALFVLFFMLLFNNLELYTAPLSISELLYADTATIKSGTCKEIIVDKDVEELERCIRGWIIQGQRDELEAYFLYLIIVDMAAGFLLLAAWRVAMPWRLHGLFVCPFVIILILYITLLPAAYGPLRVPIAFPTIHIKTKIDGLVNNSRTNYLISKTEKTFILWDSDVKELLWIPEQQINILRLMRKVRPFKLN